MNEGILIASANRGRYALKDADTGPYLDLTSGDRCEVLLGGHWIAGSIEHASTIYIDEDMPFKAHRGYYFVAADGGKLADDNGRCGLMLGMKVRLL